MYAQATSVRRCVRHVARGAATLLLACAAAPADELPLSELKPEIGPDPKLVAPLTTPSAMKFSKVIGWPTGKAPVAPKGFSVARFADTLDSPRWPYVLPNGDVLVAQSRTEPKKDDTKPPEPEKEKGFKEARTTGVSANQVVLLRDADGDGAAEERHVLLGDLNQPFGMLLLGDHLYVANTDALMRFPFKVGQTTIEAKGEKVLDLPAGGYNNHWTRNVIASRDGKKLYVTVGSATNVDKKLDQDAKDERRAAILECDPDGKNMRVFAAGLRNPNGLAWEPATGALWTAVNERDELGDELVPDYITSVADGAFYGWPYAYFGPIEDPRHKGVRPDLVKKTLKPDFAVGSHTASLGLVFADKLKFPAPFKRGVFVAQRGSWNRSEFAGYKVLFVPFDEAGKPIGDALDFLTRFLADPATRDTYGRPTGLAAMPDGSLLVTDDVSSIVWRVSAGGVAGGVGDRK